MLIIDKLVIFISLFLYTILGTSNNIGIVPILFVISITSLSTYIDKIKIHIILSIIYIILCIFLPELIIFLPLVCYDIIFTNCQLICILSIIPILTNFNLTTLIITLIFFFITILMKYKTQKLQNQTTAYKKYRDELVETSLNLEKNNKELLEKQDYEINIAILNERNRIAMEIHDNVGHLLSSSILQIGAMLAINKDVLIQSNLETVNTTLSYAMDSIRNSVHNIHDDSLKLEPQVQSIINSFKFCIINLDYDILINPNPQITYCIIAILKESLSNIIKHSKATYVSITLREHPALYQLIISDNGISVDINIKNGGIGIKNMENRIYALHGNINITTENGFRIFITIPKGDEIDESFNN